MKKNELKELLNDAMLSAVDWTMDEKYNSHSLRLLIDKFIATKLEQLFPINNELELKQYEVTKIDDNLLQLALVGQQVLTDVANGDADEWIVNDEILNANQLLEKFKSVINNI